MPFIDPRARVPLLRTFALAGVVSALVLCLNQAAFSTSSYQSTWSSLYSTSKSETNAAGAGSACYLCHAPGSWDYFNGYGWKMRQFDKAGKSKTQSILLSGPFDSDADPTGSTNDFEIGLHGQPGWTAGKHNTIYYKNGTTKKNQAPPSGMLGNIDPPTGSWTDLGNGLAGSSGTPVLQGSGMLLAGKPVTLSLSNALPGSQAWLMIGLSQANLPFLGGTLVPSLDVVVPALLVGGAGSLVLGATWPAGIATGSALYFQYWVVDTGAPAGASASNGLSAVTP